MDHYLKGMGGIEKRHSAGLALTALAVWAGWTAQAQDSPVAPVVAQATTATAGDSARLDALFIELAEPGRADWERVEDEIARIWSRSGSESMDLLLRRGNDAVEAEDFGQALDFYSALIDHAPDFAEGWNARATVYFLMGEYSLSIADIEHVLALNPRHFGALAGLASMFEDMGQPGLALRALRAAQTLNPNRPNINEAATRLERITGAAEL